MSDTRDKTILSRLRRILGAGAVTAAELPAGVTYEASRFAEGNNEHTGLFVGLFLDPSAAAELAIPGGEQAEQLHITLCYVANAVLDDLALARAIVGIDDNCGYFAPLTGTVSGYGRFQASEGSDGQDVFVALPDVVGLASLRSSVTDALSWRGIATDRGPHDWTPHITLAYVDSGAANPVESLPATALRFDAIMVAYGDKMVRLALRGFESGYLYGETVVGKGETGARLFTEVAFAEPPDTVPVLPKPGTYQHSLYGRIDLTPERIERFVSHHNERIYQDQVPIDAEHETKLSGAVGYVGDMFLNEDGSASAKVDWTDRGRSLIEADGYKYVSPEWFDSWQDPAPDGQSYEDVLIGLAITTRPFFKDGSLQRLVASEDASATEVAASAAMTNDPVDAGTKGVEMTATTNVENKTASDPAAATAPVQMTEEQIKAVEDRVAAKFAEQLSAKDAQITKLSERVEKQEADARNKRFNDEVYGRVEGGVRWFGDPTKKVAHLEKLATAFGEDSDEVKDYIAENRTHAEQLRKSELFKEFGGDGEGGGDQSAWDQIEAEAKKLQASEPTLTSAQARARILKERTDLAQKYNEETSRKR